VAGVSGETYAGIVPSPDASVYDRCEAAGAWTAPFLAEHPEAERELVARFRARMLEAARAGWAGRREGAGVDRPPGGGAPRPADGRELGALEGRLTIGGLVAVDVREGE
jgi:hypothetical protein